MSGDRGGCRGGLILVVVAALLVIAGAAWLTGELAQYNDAEASRLYARSELEASHARGEADIIRAQDQARINQITAEAQARAAIIAADSQARLDQAIAEAQMVLAQGQARLDSAQAFAVTAGASLPWLVVALVGVAGVVLLAAIVAIFSLALAAISGRMHQEPYFPPAQRRPRRPQIVIEQPSRAALPAAEGAFVQAFVLKQDDVEEWTRWESED